MYSLKGFIEIEALVKNNVGVNSVIGELSVLASTYSRERGDYFNPTYPGFNLVTLSSVTDSTKVPVDPVLSSHVLEVAKYVYDYCLLKAGGINQTDFNADISTYFAEEIQTLNFGLFVSNGDLSLPAFMSWTNPLLPANVIKIWFADSAFRQQYDQFEIIVIPPVPDLDDFYLAVSAIQTKVQSRSIPELVDLIQASKLNNPETVLRTNSYDYYNPVTSLPVFETLWSVLIYGAAGDNIDTIKDATIAYILANSTHSRAEWTVILPDLFKRTEFVVLPRWTNLAIPNLTTTVGIYSPVINLRESNIYAKAKVPEYTSAHIDLYLTALGVNYKSLAVLCISNPENRDGKFELRTLYPDYINVGTNSLDFNRMSAVTQEFVDLLERMLIVAETMTEFSDVPPEVRRVKRGTRVFASAVYDNIQYLVLSRSTA
jgi:hypothetical protein